MIWSQLINIWEARVRIPLEALFFKASFFQSAELQHTWKDHDFISFFNPQLQKKIFHCQDKWTFIFDNKLFLNYLLDALQKMS